MEETELSQEGKKDNSAETIIKNQLELIKLAPLGTYWKQVCTNILKHSTRINDYYHITRLEQHGTSTTLNGERLQVDETCLYDMDDRATLYDFSFIRKKDDTFYWEQITKEEYEQMRKKVIDVFENKKNEIKRRSSLFEKFSNKETEKYSYTQIMEFARKRYENLKSTLEENSKFLKQAQEQNNKELESEIFKEIESLKKRARLLVYSETVKNQWPDSTLNYNIHEIDVTSLNFKAKSYMKPYPTSDKEIGYVDGSPFEENGDNFWFKIKFYTNSLHSKTFNKNYYETELRTYFDDGNKNWRWEDVNGWRDYMATKDKYTNGSYRNSPVWPNYDEKFFIIDEWHFEQLVDLIKYTGL